MPVDRHDVKRQLDSEKATKRGTRVAPLLQLSDKTWGGVMEQQMIMSADADSAEMMRCIEACEACHRLCLHMAMNHCLESGGEHVEPGHFRAMLVCADLCRATADAMLSSFAYHEVLCSACSRICDECAESCERVGDMDECVHACRRCAESCERMSGSAGRSEYKSGTRRLGGEVSDNNATPSL